MFATDFPHIECEWPHSRAFVDDIYAAVPAEERDKILSGNVIDYFHIKV